MFAFYPLYRAPKQHIHCLMTMPGQPDIFLRLKILGKNVLAGIIQVLF